MNMRKQKAVHQIFAAPLSLGICVLALLALALLTMVPRCAAQSDLEKTEAYIHNAVEQFSFYQTSTPHGAYLSERDHIVFNGCKVTMHVFAVSADDPVYKKESIDFDVVFNLKDLDPNVVASPQDLNHNKLPDNREWVILRTTDRGETTDRNESMMIWRGNIPASTISAYPLPAGANHAENQKLADAFSRVITLCKASSHP
jgi:hypothetical protein